MPDPNPPGPSRALGINDQGLIVGSSGMHVEGARAVAWHDRQLVDLAEIPGLPVSKAYGINSRGQVIGQALNWKTSESRAVIWEDGTVVELAPLPGDVGAYPSAINEQGQVAGSSVGEDGFTRAVLWDNGGVTDLTTYPAGSWQGEHVPEPSPSPVRDFARSPIRPPSVLS